MTYHPYKGKGYYPVDRGAYQQAMVHGVAELDTARSDAEGGEGGKECEKNK